MSMVLNPYIGFDGNAREAMEFYQSVFGGELNLSTYGEMDAVAGMAPSDNIVHAMLATPDGFTLMGADTPEARGPAGYISISLSGDDEAALTGYWEKLIGGGQVDEQLAKAPWGDSFGMCTDRFGVHWMVNISPAA